jgi:predicted dinucleotide-binding enzyme
MRVAVLGSGNGGCAVAFDWAKAGHAVRLCDFPQFTANIDAVAQHRGIYAQGHLEGFAPIEYAGHEIERAVAGADLLFLVGPAYSTQPSGREWGQGSGVRPPADVSVTNVSRRPDPKAHTTTSEVGCNAFSGG